MNFVSVLKFESLFHLTEMHGHEIRHKYVLQMKLDGQAMLINNNYQHPGVELGLKEQVEKSIYKNTRNYSAGR